MGSRKIVIRLRVKEIAESQGVNMSKLSRKSDVQYNTIRQIWDKPERDILLSTLEKIAVALDVPISDLYEVIPDQ